MKKVINSNLINIIVKIISISMSLGILLILIFIDTRVKYNYLNTVKNSNYKYLIIIVLTIMVCLILMKLLRKKKEKIKKFLEKVYKKNKLIISILFVVLFIFQIVTLQNIYFESGWDVNIIYSRVKSFLRNGIIELNTYFQKYPYFSIAPNNLFLTNVFVIIGKITMFFPRQWHSYLYKILVIIDIILIDLAGIIMVKTIENFTNKKSIKLLGAVLYIAFIGLSPWFMIPYSDTYSIIFPISILYNYTKKDKKWYNYLMIGLLSYIGYCVKPTNIIMLIAIIIVEIYRSLFEFRDKKKLKQKIKVSVISGIGILIAIMINITLLNVSKYEIERKYTFSLYHYLMMGINTETTGGWNAKDVENDLLIEDYDERVEHNKEVFLQRLKAMSPKDFCKFYIKKILLNYNDGTLAWGREGSFYRFTNPKKNAVAKVLKNYYYNSGENFYVFTNVMQFLWIFIIVFFTIGAILRKFDSKYSVAYLSIIGLTLFTLLFEGRARYLYLYTPIYVILAIMGIEQFIKIKVKKDESQVFMLEKVRTQNSIEGEENKLKKDVIIIGAGPAGLTAAYELSKEKEKYNIIVLEESNEMGGISRTVQYKKNRMDIGGHRFFSKDSTIMDFWKEIMPLQGELAFDDKILQRNAKIEQGGPDPEKEDNVMLIRSRVSRIYYLKKFFDYPITLKFDTFKNMGLKRTIMAGFSYLKSVFFKRKENSLEDFYINRFGKVLYSMFFEKYTEKVWGRHPSLISADWGKQRVKGLSITKVIKDMFMKLFKKKNNKKAETSLIEQYWYPKYGPGQLWTRLSKLAEENGVRIRKGYKVKKIIKENGKIKAVQCKVEDKYETIEGDIFISSMPLKDLAESIEGEKVPQEIYDIATNLPYRDFITVGLLLDKLKLKNETSTKTLGNIIPDCWIYVQEEKVKMGRIQIFNNWSPYLVENPQENVWIGLEYFCNENDELWNMSKEDFINMAIDELEKMNIIEKENVKDSHIEKVKKAYPAYFDTYSKIDELINYLNNIDNLYCIGRNGQHRYNNMDHSMLTALETCKNIKNDVKDKSNIWNVNVEKEYHEVKE